MKITLVILVCLAAAVVSDEATDKKEEIVEKKYEKLDKDCMNLQKAISTELDKRIKAMKTRALEILRDRLEKLGALVDKWFKDKTPAPIVKLHKLVKNKLDKIETKLEKA